MTDFLLELLSEEIPARMQAKARTDLEKLFAAQLAEAGLKADNITVYSTPRRLALIATGLPEQTEAVREERKGPRADAPDKAIEGFLRGAGVERSDLETREVKGQPTLFAVIDTPGRATRDVLAEAVPAIIAAFPWPKSMRWGAASSTTESLKWVRPLQGIVALFGQDLVPCEIGGVAASYDTVGHRFHHSGPITIGGADDYVEKLRACHVIVDQAERAAIIRDGAAKAAADAGLVLVEDEGLVIENAGLTEWPVPLLGRYDAAFLDVPEEVIQLTTRINQKYFVVRDDAGNLAPAFVCTANIAAHDGGKAIVAGNEKVLAARLSDAKFFWELDQQKTLEQHAEKLKDIVFHEKLGTVADKANRVAKLARWLVEEGIILSSPSQMGRGTGAAGGGVGSQGTGEDPSTTSWSPSPNRLGEEQKKLADMAEQAARLCKADLVTEMVGEFPELQGLMGGYYAEKEGLPIEVSDAIRDHYKPVGQGDVPTAPVTVAVSLADKLDTLVGFWLIREVPTGSRDPFALRRAALGAIRIIVENRLRLGLLDLMSIASQINCDQILSGQEFLRQKGKLRSQEVLSSNQYVSREIRDTTHPEIAWDVLDFFADRLKVQQREAGVRHDLIDAVFALGGEDDLVRLLARVKALQAFVETEDGVNLLAGYKRASNILKKEAPQSVTPAQAGVQGDTRDAGDATLDSSLRRNHEGGEMSSSPLPFRGGAGGGGSQSDSSPAGSPHPNPSPEGEGLQNRPEPLATSPEPAEAALIAALDRAEPKAAAAIEAEDFGGAMAALASLRGPIDTFFEGVTVNDDDPAKRAARLALLARVRDAVQEVADFSKIEG